MTINKPRVRNRISDHPLLVAAEKLGKPSVYALAKEVNRPYRRVLERVKTLAEAGYLELEPDTYAGRAIIRVSVPKRNPKTPAATFPLIWSRPDGQVTADVRIAAALFRPSFSGLLDLVSQFGLVVVETAAARLADNRHWHPRAREDALHILHNIKVGHDRAAA